MNDVWLSEEGPKVVELGSGISAAYATRLLAGFGSDVVKVEAPTGDATRRSGPFPQDREDPDKGGLWMYLNAGKRSICLDLATPLAVELLGRLTATADLVIENLGPGEFDGLGLPAEALPERLVVCSISAYGQDGPKAQYRASEIGVYAAGGMMYISGDGAREPVKHGLNQAAHLAGVHAASASLAAIMAARATGIGQRIDISEQEVVALTIFPALNIYSHNGGVMRRAPSGIANLVNSSPMETKDGYIMPSYAGFGQWEAFAAFLGIPELAGERFLTPAGRLGHGEEIDELVQPLFRKRSKHELFHEGQEWGFTFTAVQDAADIVACPHLAERGYLLEHELPDGSTFRMPGRVPFEVGQAPAPMRAAPKLGAHTEAVLTGLGATPEELRMLTEPGTPTR